MGDKKTHWKRLTNPDYLGAYALNEGQELIATIQYVCEEKVIGTDGKKEDCTVAHFQERDLKPMILNATNCKTITKLYKTPYIEEWSGRKIQIFSDHVKAFGEVVEALRIRPFIPKVAVLKQDKPIACTDCGAVIEPFGKMTAAQMSQYTQDKYGKPLCAECAKKAAEDKTNIESEARELTGALDSMMGEGEKV